ncbi:hypothetical protein [Streptomyces sp. NPDC047028]|uniref:hypothetical protein n=1 Tax=Streptomyces sp. NPDC047028 TaxID=3155793 RepID=UPI0033EC39C4
MQLLNTVARKITTKAALLCTVPVLALAGGLAFPGSASALDSPIQAFGINTYASGDWDCSLTGNPGPGYECADVHSAAWGYTEGEAINNLEEARDNGMHAVTAKHPGAGYEGGINGGCTDFSEYPGAAWHHRYNWLPGDPTVRCYYFDQYIYVK